jgi:hypothetical protein
MHLTTRVVGYFMPAYGWDVDKQPTRLRLDFILPEYSVVMVRVFPSRSRFDNWPTTSLTL